MSLPRSLERFEADLEDAVSRDLARSRHRRRERRVRAVVLTGAAAMLALAAVAVAPERGGMSAVARAAAVLQPERGEIVHRETVERAEGEPAPARVEHWQRGRDWRTVRTERGVTRESSLVGGRFQFFDRERATIYEIEVPQIKLRVPAKARRQQAADDDGLVTKLEFLLASGKLRETGRTTVRGREAVRLESHDGRSVYLADADSFVPLEWRNPGGSGRIRFLQYETLPAGGAPLRLSDAYPDVKVVRGAEAERASVDRW